MIVNFWLFYYPMELLCLLITARMLRIELSPGLSLLIPLPVIIAQYLMDTTAIGPLQLVTATIVCSILLVRFLLKENILLLAFFVVTIFSLAIPILQISVILDQIVFHRVFSETLSSFSATLRLALPLTVLLLLIYYLVKRSGYSLLDNSLHIITGIINRKIIWATVLIMTENIFFFYYFSDQLIMRLRGAGPIHFTLFIVSLVSVFLIFIGLYLFNLINREVHSRGAASELENLSRLNFTLKTQQHDFKHHLQLLMSLIQMKKYERVLEYIRNVNQEIQEINQLIFTGLAPLDGLLQYKLSLAQRHNIDLEITVNSNLEYLPLAESKTCRLIGNLVENAIEYLKDKEEIERGIFLFIYESDVSYHIQVTNPVEDEPIFRNGPGQLLTPGFTSKGKGHGLGLYIVKQIVEEAGGRIEPELDRARGVLSFKLTLPREITQPGVDTGAGTDLSHS